MLQSRAGSRGGHRGRKFEHAADRGPRLCASGAAVAGLLLFQHHGEPAAVGAVNEVCGDGQTSGCEQVARSSWSSLGRVPLAAIGLALSLVLATAPRPGLAFGCPLRASARQPRARAAGRRPRGRCRARPRAGFRGQGLLRAVRRDLCPERDRLRRLVARSRRVRGRTPARSRRLRSGPPLRARPDVPLRLGSARCTALRALRPRGPVRACGARPCSERPTYRRPRPGFQPSGPSGPAGPAATPLTGGPRPSASRPSSTTRTSSTTTSPTRRPANTRRPRSSPRPQGRAREGRLGRARSGRGVLGFPVPVLPEPGASPQRLPAPVRQPGPDLLQELPARPGLQPERAAHAPTRAPACSRWAGSVRRSRASSGRTTTGSSASPMEKASQRGRPPLRHAKRGSIRTPLAPVWPRRSTRDRLTAQIAEAKRLGVQSTPTFFVNGKKLPRIKDFVQVVDKEAQAKGFPPLQEPPTPSTDRVSARGTCLIRGTFLVRDRCCSAFARPSFFRGQRVRSS